MAENVPGLPFDRADILDVSAEYERLRTLGPVARVRTPAGDPAWLVCRYDVAHALFSDPRLGRSHPYPDRAAKIYDAGLMGGPTGDPRTEKQDHARMRRLVGPAFSQRRMHTLTEHVRLLAADLIEGMVGAHDGGERPIDLHSRLAEPLPVMVICELLGVPLADRDYFRGLSERASVMYGGDSRSALAELRSYTAKLAVAKRETPAEDLMSDLIAAQRDDSSFTDEQMAGFVAAVLFAGHETTVKRIDIGVLLLDRAPQVWRQLAADPASVSSVVEEILRMAAPSDLSAAPRYAQDDITVSVEGYEPVVIARGDAVLMSLSATNRDPRAFPDPDRFDATRSPNAHVAFGGVGHFCLGQALARTELRAVFSQLPRRLPDLRGGRRGASAQPLQRSRDRRDREPARYLVTRFAQPNKRRQQEERRAMRIHVDWDRCTGMGMCESLAPDVFELDDDGTLTLHTDIVPDGKQADARAAVASCPTEALSLSDD